MAYVILSLIGLAAVLLVGSNWKQHKQILFISMAIVCGTVLYVIIDLNFTGGMVEKGSGSFWENIPWKEIGLYFAMVAGMAAKYFYEAIGEGNTISFRKWQFLKPMFISPLVFGAIYTQTPPSASGVFLMIFSFQNGFFWQTVLAKVRN